MKKKLISIFFVIFILIMLSFVTVYAAETGISVLSASPAAAEEAGALGAVQWYYSGTDGCRYLFLHGSEDRSALRIWFSSDLPVYCGETELINGEVTDIFASGSAVLTCGDNTYTVKVLNGDTVGAVYINTESGSLDTVHADKEYKEPGEILVLDADSNVLYNGVLSYIKGRGNSTWNGAKKPYNIKLDKKADLFGMGKAKKWCLLANAGDGSFLRNMLSYDLAQNIGVEVTSDTVPVNLFVNGNYMGAYLLTEKVEVGSERVDIYDLEGALEELNGDTPEIYSRGGQTTSVASGTSKFVKYPTEPAEYTGGYLLELEKYYRYREEISGFVSSRGQCVVVKTPEYASKKEINYISSFYQDFEDALYSPTGYNMKGMHYSEYADIDSIAMMYIAEEFGANFDGCSSSFFLYKDVDGKLTAGPAWDFDLAFRSTSGINTLINRTCPTDDPSSLYIQTCFIDNRKEEVNSFLAQAFTHDDFRVAVQRVWQEKVCPYYSTFTENITSWSALLDSSMIMNSIRWNSYGSTDPAVIRGGIAARVKTVSDYTTARFEFLSEAYDQSTFFVQYDIGSFGKALVHDVNLYHAGDKAVVKKAPGCASSELHFACWTTQPDGSGEKYYPGDLLTINDDTHLYAQWEKHYTAADIPCGFSASCDVCGKSFVTPDHIPEGGEPCVDDIICSICGELLLKAEGHRYENVDGVLMCTACGKKYNGLYTDSRYYTDGVFYTGMQSVNGCLCVFSENGEFTGKFTGVYNGYYYHDGLAEYAGLIEYNGYIYYAGNKGIVKTGIVYVYASKTNGLKKQGEYEFDTEGRMIITSYIENGYYYLYGKKTYAGLVCIDGDYYYATSGGRIKTGSFEVFASKANGLLPPGIYTFGEDGKMQKPEPKNGIYNGCYYVNDVKTYAGLIKLDGDYYYATSGGKIKTGTFYVYASKANGLLPPGEYTFDADGKMQKPEPKNGVYNGYYYVNDVKTYAGLVEFDGGFYYATSGGKIKTGTFMVYGSKANGLVPAGEYTFDANGRMLKA